MTAVLEKPMKLNLGGMGEGFLDGRIPGFTVVDLRDGADIKANVRDLSFAGTGTIEEVYASNVLEHFSLNDTVDVLKEWCRVLKPGGKLYVSVPDFDVAVKLYQQFGLTQWIRFHLWGDQKHELNYHYTCFTFGSLAKDLSDAGFADVKRVKFFHFGAKDGSTNVDSLTHVPISLNVVATK